MKGFKGFYFTGTSLFCKTQEYEVGKTYTKPDKPVVCVYGFHFCDTLRKVLKYYPIDRDHFFCEVSSVGWRDSEDNYKFSSSNLKIEKLLSYSQVMEKLKGRRAAKTYSNETTPHFELGLITYLFETPELYKKYLSMINKINKRKKILYSGNVWKVRIPNSFRQFHNLDQKQTWEGYAVITEIAFAKKEKK